jgi:hypothetical protein
MIQATTTEAIRAAVSRFGVAPGAQVMLNLERQAFEFSVQNGLYVTWRLPSSNSDCTRVGPGSKCFCGHHFEGHNLRKRYNPCGECKCNSFKFIPQRPEEVGEWWLVRRKEFDIRTYRVKCKCNHSHEEHDPVSLSCKFCTCYSFTSNFLCLVCDKHWEEHETIYESEEERRRAGRTFGQEYMPLESHKDIQAVVFKPQPGTYVRKVAAPKTKSVGPSRRK